MICEKIMNTPDGTSNTADKNKPIKHPKKPINTDRIIIFTKLDVNKFAVICGTVSSDISITIPTRRMLSTMVMAMNIIIPYFTKLTGSLRVLAKSESKAV